MFHVQLQSSPSCPDATLNPLLGSHLLFVPLGLLSVMLKISGNVHTLLLTGPVSSLYVTVITA